MFATKAQYDPVPLYGELTGHFGTDPTQQSFGAHEFTSDSGGTGPWYALGWNPAAHSAYWDDGNSSLVGMGKIVAGNGANVS